MLIDVRRRGLTAPVRERSGPSYRCGVAAESAGIRHRSREGVRGPAAQHIGLDDQVRCLGSPRGQGGTAL